MTIRIVTDEKPRRTETGYWVLDGYGIVLEGDENVQEKTSTFRIYGSEFDSYREWEERRYRELDAVPDFVEYEETQYARLGGKSESTFHAVWWEVTLDD